MVSMDSIHIQGGVALQGTVCIQGSKNASLPVLAATLLTKEPSYLYNCPRISDVHGMISLLKSLGCHVKWMDGGVCVDAGALHCAHMPAEAIMGMRSSLCLLGTLLGRCNEVIMEQPGGCVIGARPINLHIQALSAMGVEFEQTEGQIHAVTRGLHGADIVLPFASVGVTENILLAAIMAEGDTTIQGAAREPEIVALCEYLEACGADIEGIGTGFLKVKGGRNLYGTEYTIPTDRIVAGTYLFGCVGAGGNVLLKNAPWQSMKAVLDMASRMGAQCICGEEGLYVQAPERPMAIPHITTAVYPGFPTDLQSAVLAVLGRADGTSIVEETVFENRFRIVEHLVKMGADIRQDGNRKVVINGVGHLFGKEVEARELRGGAALILAGLMAEGETTVRGCSYVYRGYENICKDLRELGARIVSV